MIEECTRCQELWDQHVRWLIGMRFNTREEIRESKRYLRELHEKNESELHES
jgi:hypothetical protein